MVKLVVITAIKKLLVESRGLCFSTSNIAKINKKVI